MTFATELTTEPYEVAWAREARIFVRALDLAGEIEATAEISAGRTFLDTGRQPTVKLTQPGLLSFSVREFGHWLRIVLRNRASAPWHA